MVIKDDELKMVPVKDEEDWKPPPRIGVELIIPDGIRLILTINGVRLMPEDGD